MSTSAVGRLVVVSPHLDDAVLSVGAFIGYRSAQGAEVVVLTVFAGDPESALPASNWDGLAGFATEGEAARERRREDAAACATLGAHHHWLAFPDWPYADGRDERAVLSAIEAAVDEDDDVLVPGFPLLHPDHRYVSECALRGNLRCRSLGLYVEQPYRYRVRRLQKEPLLDGSIAQLLGAPPVWQPQPVDTPARRLKRHAVQAYASQLPLLDLGRRYGRLRRMLDHEARRGGELVAWVRGASV